jgi:co-chaperonin GroES (HSP10)
MGLTKEQYIAEHFPTVECGAVPCGPKIIVQLRTLKAKSSGGIILASETKELNTGNTKIARVVKVGQIAFRDRTSGETWKEGAWAEIGDIVIIPSWGGFRFEVPIPGQEEKAIFAIIDDTNVQTRVESCFESFDVLL